MKKTILLTMIMLSVLVITGCTIPTKKTGVGIEKAKEIVLGFVNENMMQPGTSATIKEASEEKDMYKVVISAGGQDVPTYLSLDGKQFFPNAVNIEEFKKEAENQKNNQQANAEIQKNDKPVVELFVMSYCPYGTQMEKGIIPVVEALGSKIDFKLKFVDYLMHGEKEMTENLRQYCIEKNEPAKILAYLKCFLKDGKSDGCLKSTGINQSLLSGCENETDAKYKIKENFSKGSQNPSFEINKDDNEKYGVKGSPTLVVNGSVASSGRDSASILKTVCSAFNNPPVECQKELSATAPAPGFGEGTGSGTNASCGS